MPQHDGHTGRLITLNHFREIKKIYDRYKVNQVVRNDQCAAYVRLCWETHFMYKDIIKKQQREYRLVLGCKIALVVILVVTAVKFFLDRI